MMDIGRMMERLFTFVLSVSLNLNVYSSFLFSFFLSEKRKIKKELLGKLGIKATLKHLFFKKKKVTRLRTHIEYVYLVLVFLYLVFFLVFSRKKEKKRNLVRPHMHPVYLYKLGPF